VGDAEHGGASASADDPWHRFRGVGGHYVCFSPNLAVILSLDAKLAKRKPCWSGASFGVQASLRCHRLPQCRRRAVVGPRLTRQGSPLSPHGRRGPLFACRLPAAIMALLRELSQRRAQRRSSLPGIRVGPRRCLRPARASHCRQNAVIMSVRRAMRVHTWPLRPTPVRPAWAIFQLRRRVAQPFEVRIGRQGEAGSVPVLSWCGRTSLFPQSSAVERPARSTMTGRVSCYADATSSSGVSCTCTRQRLKRGGDSAPTTQVPVPWSTTTL